MQKELIRAIALFAALLALLGCFAALQAAPPGCDCTTCDCGPTGCVPGLTCGTYRWQGENDCYALFQGATRIGLYNPKTKLFKAGETVYRATNDGWVDVTLTASIPRQVREPRPYPPQCVGGR